MSKPDLKLAMERAQRSVLESKFISAMGKMSPEQQEAYMKKIIAEIPEVSVEANMQELIESN